MEEEIIAKKNKTVAENTEKSETATGSDATTDTSTTSDERPEMPSGENGEMTGWPMGGGMPGEMTTQTSDENDWLVPMSAAGVVAGSVIAAAIAICIVIWKCSCKCGCKCNKD